MLFILTAPAQSGKTRWLQGIVSELEERGINCRGVLAPGVWEDHGEAAGTQRFVKLGIDNLLLPQHETVHFAKLPELDGGNLCWDIDEDALAQVNAHFANLAATLSDVAADSAKTLTVIDELGPLELQQNGGLTEAVKLLGEGPKPGLEDVLVVVRQELLSLAVLKFAFWGEFQMIWPDDAGRRAVITQMGFRV